MSFQGLKDYFSRHFLGRVKVYSYLWTFEVPQTVSLRRVVETHPVRTSIRVLSAALLPLEGLRCHNKEFRFPAHMVRVYGEKVRSYAPREIVVRGFSPLRVVALQDLKRAMLLPLEKENRLAWLKERPQKTGELILAWFGPIIEEALVKLVLNKQRGTLLIWYNPHSRHFLARSLYLYRRLGPRQKPGWQWVDWR
ncbi:MAG: hypothetical protein GX256_01875 [Fretibacterium sp.]|nr:hypothetical protein [Fretibacterium sp.]